MHEAVVPRRGTFERWRAALRAALAALLLTACTSYPPLTPAQEVYQLQLQFDAVLAEVELYAAQPPCSPTLIVGCHNPDTLASIAAALTEADRQLDLAAAAVRSGAAPSTVAALANAARAALAVAAREIAAESTR